MNLFENEAKKIINEVLEALETLSLNDQEAWQQLCEKVKAFLTSVPPEMIIIKEGLDICHEGICEISESKISNPLSLIDAIYDLFDAILNTLTGSATDTEKIEKTKERLLNLLLKERKQLMPNDENNAISEENAGPLFETSLNDIAMMLIQLEQDDWAGVEDIKQGLKNIYKNPLFEDPVKQKVEKALEVSEHFTPENGAHWDTYICDISNLIDEAVAFENQRATMAEETTSDEDITPSETSDADAMSWDLDSDRTDELEEDDQAVTENGINEQVTPHHAPIEEPIEDVEAEEMNTEKKLPEQKADKLSSLEQIEEEIDDTDYMPDDADLEMLGEFIAESNDLIANAEEALLSLEVNPDDKDSIGMVFRAFHTVKGTAAFLELNLLSEMAHHAENLLSRVRDGEIRYSGGYADLSLKSLDMIKDLVQLVETAITGAPLLKPSGYDVLLQILENPEAEGISEDYDEDASPRVGDILVATGKVKREDLEETVSKYTDKPVGEALVKSKVSKVQDVGQALRTQTKLKGGARHAVDATVRVSTKRLDKLVDMVGEMVIAHSMIAQDDIVSDSQNHALLKKVTQTGKIVRELQDLSMSMRMIPLKATFQKMARLVRDVGRKVGKNVNLITEGEDTEIDRNLVDFINDPLVHMVRNSVDHGIESPEERVKLGKPTIGTIKLSAYHSAGNVVVEISDDGKGLNKDLILQKAIERNLIEKGKSLSDKEIYNLIFEPGFSTAQTVTDVSGRGVGMDVVRKNIETLRGQVEINSEYGKGSVFKINLPLTLAIIDGMVIRVANESYVLPTESIVRSIKPEPKDISTVFNEGKVLSIQGKLIPLFRLSRLYDIALEEDTNDQALVVIIEDDTTRAGIIIDELVGRQQVVVKSLGETMKGIPGISGGAIMPNGRVGLIVDVGGLIRLIHSGFEKLKEAEKAEEMKVAV